MGTKILKTALMVAGSALLMSLAINPAAAVPITFTWNPSGSSPALANQSAFTASDITVDDFAAIMLPSQPTGIGQTVSGITENGYLSFANFNAPTPGLNDFTGGGGPNNYELYIKFTASSTLTEVAPGDLVGSFDSLNYTLYGDKGGNCVFGWTLNTPSVSCGADTQVALATGTLAPGVNTASIIQGTPSAQVFTNINVGPGQSGFFVAPGNTALLSFDSSFTNTIEEVSTVNCSPAPGPCTYLLGMNIDPDTGQYNPGGGSINLVSAPEPLTLAMFGSGLVGIGAIARRRRAKRKA